MVLLVFKYVLKHVTAVRVTVTRCGEVHIKSHGARNYLSSYPGHQLNLTQNVCGISTSQDRFTGHSKTFVM